MGVIDGTTQHGESRRLKATTRCTVALPQMDSDPTAVDRVPSTSLTTATCIREARARLGATGESAAVVTRGGRPVGVVTATTLAGATTSSQGDAPLITVMDYVAVPVSPHAYARETVQAFTRAAWDWLGKR